MRYTLKIEIAKVASLPIELFQIIYLFPIAFLSRLSRRKVDVGIGPDPLINNIYHKKSLNQKGYTAETFCYSSYYITDNFDHVFFFK